MGYELRKVQKRSNMLIISIPANWARRHDLKAGDRVLLADSYPTLSIIPVRLEVRPPCQAKKESPKSRRVR